MRYVLLLLLFLSSSNAYGQAVWGRKAYTQPVCSNPNCRMCYTAPNSISNQLAAQRQQTSYSFQTFVQPQYVVPKFEPAQEPTPIQLMPLIFELLQPKPNDVFIDIGCGDGRVLVEAKKHMPASSVLGIDLKPTPVPGVAIVTGDARDFDYSNITLAYIYLYPDLMVKVIDKLPSCTRIVSYSHTTPGIEWKQYGNFFLGTKP